MAESGLVEVSGQGGIVTTAAVVEASPPYVEIGLRIVWGQTEGSTEFLYRASGPSRREMLAVALHSMSLELHVSATVADARANSELKRISVDLSP